MITIPDGKHDLYVAAALADMIYARDPDDQAVTLQDIADQLGGSPTVLSRGQVSSPDNDRADTAFSELSSGGVVQSSNEYFYSNTGFVGAIIQDGSKYIVVLRGSDTGSPVTGGDFPGAMLFGESHGGNLDGMDWYQNRIMGTGRLSERTQADDAIALTKAAIALAGSAENVSVVGQSLGGGLAGVVSAVLDVKAIAIAPAPFGHQIAALALQEVGRSCGLPDSLINECLGHYLNPESPLPLGVPEHLSQLGFTFAELAQYTNVVRDQYNANLSDNLQIHRIDGEFLSNLTDSGFAEFLGASEYFKAPTTVYELGEASPFTLHGPSGHLLTITTKDSSEDFGLLMRDDDVLRASLYDTVAISGAIDQDRADTQLRGQIGGTSQVLGGEPMATNMMRALWKSVGVEHGLYDYFFKLFHEQLRTGAAGEGLQSGGEYDGDLKPYGAFFRDGSTQSAMNIVAWPN